MLTLHLGFWFHFHRTTTVYGHIPEVRVVIESFEIHVLKNDQIVFFHSLELDVPLRKLDGC